MLLRHCDRCGKLFTPEHEIVFNLPVNNPTYTSKLRVWLSLGFDEYVDLCANCRESFISWWCEQGMKKEKKQ